MEIATISSRLKSNLAESKYQDSRRFNSNKYENKCLKANGAYPINDLRSV